MSKKKRALFVALQTLLRLRFPEITDPMPLILQGRVLVNGTASMNPKASVRSDASIRIVKPRVLRGTQKLISALRTFRLDVGGLVALDVGASAGGFTQALLDAGVGRVYALDAGSGQLVGSLRTDPRVINLERTNLAQVTDEHVSEQIDLVTMDLSYLAVAGAVGQLGGVHLSPDAHLIALVKPTFELQAGRLAASPDEVTDAVHRARHGIEACGWMIVDQATSEARGARGAVEVFLHAQRSQV